MRQAQGIPPEALEDVRHAHGEAALHEGRGPEEQQQQPRVLPEVADEPEVALAAGALGVLVEPQAGHLLQQRPQGLGNGEVVVQPGDGLHPAAVTMLQADAVDGLGAADEGAAVLPDGNLVVGGQRAGHAGAPQRLAVDVGQRDLVDLGQLGQAGLDVLVHAGDQLHLGFAEVGGDARVRERSAQRPRVRAHGQAAIGRGTQAFFFQAAGDPAQRGGFDGGQAGSQ